MVSVLLGLDDGIFIIGKFLRLFGGGVRLIFCCVFSICVVVSRLGKVLLFVVCWNGWVIVMWCRNIFVLLVW